MILARMRRLLAPPVFEGDDEKTRVTRLLNGVLWTLLGLAVVAAPPLIFFSGTASDRLVSIATVAGMVVPVIGLLWLIRQGRPRVASAVFLSILLVVLAANTLFYGGIRNTMTSGYLLIIVMAVLLLDTRGTSAFVVATLLVVLGLFWAERTYEGFPVFPMVSQPSVGDLIIFFAISTLMAVLMGFALNDLANALGRARQGEEELIASNRELRASRDALQATMFDLGRRNEQVRLASEVARDAAAAQGLERILERAVNLIRSRFDLHHVGIFLVDEQHEYAVLRAAAGHGAEEVLEEEVRLRIGAGARTGDQAQRRGRGGVGYVTTTGQPYLVQDTREDPGYARAEGADERSAPTEVRSGVTLPLRAGDEIIGAVTFQSQEVGAFDEDDVAVLQIMADQLAVAIENARLLNEMEQAVRELELASGQYTRESWRALGRGRARTHGYRYRRLGVEPAHDYPAEAREAWREGRPVVTSQSEDGGDGRSHTNAAAIPIKLREQVIGMFKLSSKEGAISPEALSLVQEAADRLALALENARLLEETQRRARRERLVADITAKVRASSDVETIMQTAVRELGRAIDADRARVLLGGGSPSDSPRSEGSGDGSPSGPPQTEEEDES